MTVRVRRAPTRSDHARDLSLLGLGSAVSGLLAYVVFALTTRGLGAHEAAPVAMLWTIWGLTTAALGFPLQHWVTRSAARLGDTGGVRQALPAVTGIAIGITALVLVGCWLLGETLFGQSGLVFPALAALLTLASAVAGVQRGSLSVDQRFSAVAATLVLENAYRVVGVVALQVAGVESAAAYGLVIATGNLTGLLWIGAVRFHGSSTGDGEQPLRFLGGVAGGQLLSQLALTGGPALLAVVGGSPTEVTVLFTALSLYRAPYLLAVGMVARLTGRFAEAAAAGNWAPLSRVRRTVAVVTVVGGLAAAAFGATVGVWVLPLVFGPEVVLGPLPSALLAAGGTIAVANLVLTILVIAYGRTALTTAAWAVALVVALILLVVPVDPLLRVCWGFLGAQGVAWTVLLKGAAPRAGR